MFEVHPEIRQVRVSPEQIQGIINSLKDLLAMPVNAEIVNAYGWPYYATVSGIGATIGYLQDYGISNEDINTLITVPQLRLPTPTPGLVARELVAREPTPVDYPIDAIGANKPNPVVPPGPSGILTPRPTVGGVPIVGMTPIGTTPIDTISALRTAGGISPLLLIGGAIALFFLFSGDK